MGQKEEKTQQDSIPAWRKAVEKIEDTAKEFVLSMGGIAGAGYGFRLLAQQASKILNVFWAGSGSAVSASIAALGTSAIGKAAIAYYIDDKTIEEAKSTFEASRKED